MSTPQPIEFDWEACRRGTREAILTALQRFGSGERTLSINMPTRYGKTHTGRLITAIGTRGWITKDGQVIAPFAAVNLWVTVNVMLRDQAASKDHWQKFNSVFRPSQNLIYGSITEGYDSLGKFVRNARPNDEDFLAVTIQQLHENIDIYVQWIESLAAQGLGVIVHFDETHLLNEDKPWGKIVKLITDAGGRIVGWTATPRRADGGIIPGFHPTFVGSETRDISVLKEIIYQDSKRFGRFEDQIRQTTDYLLDADVNIPFTEAWNEGYLLKASWLPVDVDLTEIDGENHEELRNVKLSQLMPSTCAKHSLYGKCARQTKTVRRAVALAYEQMLFWRRLSPRAAVIGYTVSDRHGGRNEHANQIKREFLRLDPALKILIVTQNVDESAALLQNFEESDYDIILVKGMAGIGWDCARIQVVLDLSDVRQPATLIQRWMRGGTPYNFHTAFSLIVLADQLNGQIFQECCTDLGGTASLTTAEIIDEEIRELEDRIRNPWVINGAKQGNFADSDNNQAAADLAPLSSTRGCRGIS
jgi:superfamily II DNA or RNA helicase